MLRSLYSGISGMRNHQIRMDVTGNNIANVNTTGYKSGRVNFQDTLSQTIRSGGDGRNAAQVGSGMTVGSISTNFTQGPMQSTGRTLDLAIQGNGLFVLSDGANEYYSKEGVLFLDTNGYLVNSDGLKVQSKNGGNIKVYNVNPVSSINIGPDGTISGTDSEGDPLKFISGQLQYEQDTPAKRAEFIGDKSGIAEPRAKIVASGNKLVGDNIVPFTPPVEAEVKGTNDVVVSLGIDATPGGVDLSGKKLTISLNGTTVPIDMSSVTGVDSWQTLKTKLQNAIDTTTIPGPPPTTPLKDKIIVDYDNETYGGLIFKTQGTALGVPPQIAVAGADANDFFGSSPSYTQGTAGTAGKFVGKKLQIDVGNGWQYIETTALLKDGATASGLDNIQSGADLATKLQAYIDDSAGGLSNVTVTWANDHLEFSSNSTSSITLGGEDITDFIGMASSAEDNNINWSDKDITIRYNGSTYNFSTSERIEAGFDKITSGTRLRDALQALIDKKIGKDKVEVTWTAINNDNGNLSFKTLDSPTDGTKPDIYIGGIDAEFFVGKKPTVIEGEPYKKGQPKDQGNNNVIRLVSFQNPEGLNKVGRNLYIETQSSGSPAEANETSTIQSGYLEMSNVDLTEEFTNMITTQRGYQANARVITVSDTLLEELIQLKR